jgi:hypothetical protein
MFLVAGGVTLSASPVTDGIAESILEWDSACRLNLLARISHHR